MGNRLPVQRMPALLPIKNKPRTCIHEVRMPPLCYIAYSTRTLGSGTLRHRQRRQRCRWTINEMTRLCIHTSVSWCSAYLHCLLSTISPGCKPARIFARALLQCLPGSPPVNTRPWTALRFQASGEAEIKTVPRHFARANQADRCITLLHCAQRLTP